MKLHVRQKDVFLKFKQSKMEQGGFTSEKVKLKIQNK